MAAWRGGGPDPVVGLGLPAGRLADHAQEGVREKSIDTGAADPQNTRLLRE